MTKQEKIKLGIEEVIGKFEADSPEAGYGYEKEEMAQAIIEYLHENGVAIKVDKPFRISESVNSDGVTAFLSLMEK